MPAIFVLVDALGWDLVKGRPFLNDILPYRKPLETVFGFSSAAIPSILTGLRPDGHGHWNLFLYSPESSPFRWTKALGWMPRKWLNSRVVRKAVSEISRRTSGTQGYFQIYGVPVEILPFFDICEKDDIYAPAGLQPSRSIFDHLTAQGIPYRQYSYHEYTDDAAVRQAVQDIRSRKADFYFIYLAELDHFLHYHVAEPAQVDVRLKAYADSIESIYRSAVEADPNTAFYVFSDHGMTPIVETFDIMGPIQALGWKVPSDYLALYDSTMARFWFFNEGARREIVQKLETFPCGKVVTPQDRKEFGIDFGHNRFGDVVFMMKEGCLMHPSHMGRVPMPGMHGFHPRASSSCACLLARDEPAVPVERVWDMFALMKQGAGLS